jgi:flavin-dependent dehydrogenase
MPETAHLRRAPASAPPSTQNPIARIISAVFGDMSKSRVLALALLCGGALTLYRKMTAKKAYRGQRKYRSVAAYSAAQAQRREEYDVVIIGAGPAGASAGFYLSRKGFKVAVLEKRKFPRDKYCGDAVCTAAQRHLREMGVLQEIMDENKGHPQARGGFVSPIGNSFLSDSANELGFNVVVAIKRIHMDEKVAKACRNAGADLMEDLTVVKYDLDRSKKMWTVTANRTSQPDSTPVVVKGRLLLVCDGAPSRIGRDMGIIKTAPDGVCSRAFIKPGTHNFKQDGVVFYPPSLLPGYCSLMMHANNELAFCAYVIPGGDAKVDDLPRLHKDIHTKDPFVTRMMGPNAKLEPMKSATLRLGGVPKSFDEQMLIVGDAAGFIDPLIGEGIQYAMDGALLAADAVEEALLEDNLSARSMSRFQDRWMEAFGNEFFWSMKMSLMLYKYPVLLDAMALYIRQKGPEFLANWAEVMTGTKPKTFFLRPDVALPMGFVVAKEWLRQKMSGGKAAMPPPQ